MLAPRGAIRSATNVAGQTINAPNTLHPVLNIKTKRPLYRNCPYCKKPINPLVSLQEHVDNSARCLELYIGAQTKLFSFVRQKQYFRTILPCAKSSGFWLPGFGDPYLDCGVLRIKRCGERERHPGKKRFFRYFVQGCRRRDCPVCFEGWASAQAERGLIRIATYATSAREVRRTISRVKNLLMKPGSKFYRASSKVFHKALVKRLEFLIKGESRRGLPVHAMLSPPQDIKVNAEKYVDLRKEAREMVVKLGWIGGCQLFHPYRLKCNDCGEVIPDYKKGCPKCGGFKVVWKPGIHFHFVGFGRIRRHKTKENYELTGWVVKDLGVRDSVFWTLQYLLSHVGVYKDPEPGFKPTRFHVTTWFGKLAYRSLGKVPHLKVPNEVCPHCGSLLMVVMDESLGSLPPPPEDWKNNPDLLI